MRFKIGDVCVFTDGAVWGITGASVAGLECVVIDGLETRYMWPPEEERPCYEILCDQIAKHPLLAEPHELRLKRPPSWNSWLTSDQHLTDDDKLEATRANDLERYLVKHGAV